MGIVTNIASLDFSNPASILGVLRELLDCGIFAVSEFSPILLDGRNLTDTDTLFTFAGELVHFSFEALTGLVEVLISGEDVSLNLSGLGDLGDITTGSTDALSGILGLLTGDMSGLEGEATESIGNLNLPGIIDFLGNIGSSVDDELASEDVVTNYDEFIKEEETKTDNEEESKPNTEEESKKDIITENSNALFTDLESFQYDGYTLTVNRKVLDQLIEYIEDNNTYGDEQTQTLAHAYHNFLVGEKRPLEYKTSWGLEDLHDFMEEYKEPAIVRVKDNYWVTCVGYKDDGSEISDFLFIDTLDGKLKEGGTDLITNIDTIDRHEAIGVTFTKTTI